MGPEKVEICEEGGTMDLGQKTSGNGRFLAKQATLLLITVVLVASCTIPLIRAVKWICYPGELASYVDRADKELASIKLKMDVFRSKIQMGAGGNQAQDKLKTQVEELKQQMAKKELEIRRLQKQIDLGETIAKLTKIKPTRVPGPPLDSGQKADDQVGFLDQVDQLIDKIGQIVDKLIATGNKLAELLIKLAGAIGSVCTAVMFVVSWWKKLRQPQPVPAT